ncbi:MAG: histidine phosphatase family protein [Candidatus Nanopelagicales bacterium]
MALGTLVLLRHAKSAYPAGVADHDRPLNERGRDDARAAGVWLREHRDSVLGINPAVLVSTAKRAQATWRLAGTELSDIAAQTQLRLYEASVSTLVDVVAPFIEAGRSILVVAHNPGLEQLAGFLTSGHDNEARQRLLGKFPTCGIAVLSMLDAQWSDTSAELIEFAVPRG